MVLYDRMFDLKIKVDHCDLYFTVQWFCLISWRLFDVWTWQFGTMVQYDRMFDLKINVDHCGLYFTVQWFCLISWRLFDEWTWQFGKMVQYWFSMTGCWTQNINRSLRPKFHGSVILPYILNTISCVNMTVCDNGSVWPDVWPQNKDRSLWPIFHGWPWHTGLGRWAIVALWVTCSNVLFSNKTSITFSS